MDHFAKIGPDSSFFLSRRLTVHWGYMRRIIWQRDRNFISYMKEARLRVSMDHVPALQQVPSLLCCFLSLLQEVSERSTMKYCCRKPWRGRKGWHCTQLFFIEAQLMESLWVTTCTTMWAGKTCGGGEHIPSSAEIVCCWKGERMIAEEGYVISCALCGVVRCDKQPGALEPALRTSREIVRQ